MVFYTFSVLRGNGAERGPHDSLGNENLNHLRQTLINLADLEALDL